MDIRKSIIKVFSANLLQLITSIVVGFFVPAALSIEGYADLRTYTFYIGYVGFLHLGFVDGMYIKYGGHSIREINRQNLKLEHYVMLISQLIISIGVLCLAYLAQSILWIFVALSIFPINMYSFYKMFYQATGEFDLYTRYAYVYSLSYLALNAVLAIVLKNDNPWLYCMTTLISNIIVCVALERHFQKNTSEISADRRKIKQIVRDNIRVGFIVMWGNLAITMFYAIDQWFIKGFFTDADFAYYSFAVSMLNLINVLINAIAITFYNFLAREKDLDRIKSIKTMLIVLGTMASASYFVLAGIVNILLKKYIPSLSVISISFAAFPYIIVVNALYVNLYKVEKREKRYLKVVVQMLIVAALLNLLAVFTIGNIQGIALATTISFAIWFVYSIRDFNYLKASKKEIVYLLICFTSFFLCSQLLEWYLGGIIYVSIVLALNASLFKKMLLDQIRSIPILPKMSAFKERKKGGER